MRATEAHFRGLADTLAQLVWVVDGAGRLVYGNLAWQSFTRIHVGASFVESYVPALHLGCSVDTREPLALTDGPSVPK
jgi:PAS domain-containing protein